MRFVTNKEDQFVQGRVNFLEDLVLEQRSEITRMRAQIDEARDIPAYVFDTNGNGEAQVYVMDDKRMAMSKRGEIRPDGEET
jgi:ferritin